MFDRDMLDMATKMAVKTPRSVDSQQPPEANGSNGAEETVLGGLLIHAHELLPRIRETLKPVDFEIPQNRTIFEKILSLGQEGDLVRVTEALRYDGKLEEVGGARYLTKLAVEARDINASLECVHKIGSERPPRLGDVLDEIEALINNYIVLPAPGMAMLISVWIAGTYMYERFQYFGYLALRSATPRCGKTRLLRLISMLANGAPPITTIPTAAALFRSTRIVLLLDEVDRLRNADKETFGDVLAVLNVGFEKGAVVERVERTKDGFGVKAYKAFGPKALAGIESLADTLADRSLQIQMKRSTKRMPRLGARKLEPIAERIRKSTAAYAQRKGQAVQDAYDSLPDELQALSDFDDRFQDIAEPLLVIAAIADAERPDGPLVTSRLIKALHAAAGRREPSSRERELIAFIDLVENRLDGTDSVFIPSCELLAICQAREELSRIETTRALAGLLRNFDLFPGANSAKTVRGYMITREWVDDWKARYRGVC